MGRTGNLNDRIDELEEQIHEMVDTVNQAVEKLASQAGATALSSQKPQPQVEEKPKVGDKSGN